MTDLEERKRLHSGAYVEAFERQPLYRIERLIPLLRIAGGENLADFACGNAMLLPLVHERVAMYHGVDFSEEFIVAARRRAAEQGIRNCRFYCQDIVDFCREHEGAFDIATTFDFSEHIEDAEFVRIFTAIRSSLKPGGQLLLHTPNLDFFIERLKEYGILRQFPEHIAVRTADSYRELLAECGFAGEDIRIRGIPHYNVLRFLDSLRHLPLVGGFFIARLVIDCVR